MDLITNFILSLNWRDIATAAGVILGVVSVIAYVEQRRSSRNQEPLIEFARRHLDKETSEEVINQLRFQINQMHAQIAQSIPSMARESVLKEQLKIHENAIAQHYSQIQSIMTEFSPAKVTIDPAIERVILDRILPSYEKEQTQSVLRNRITILSVAAAISGNLFYPVNTLLQIILALPLADALYKLFRIQESYQQDIGILKRGVKIASAVIWILALMWAIMLVLDGGIPVLGRQIGIGIIVLNIIGIIFIKRIYNLIDMWIK